MTNVNTQLKIAFATSCDLNYLAQAHTLAKSVKNIYPNSTFILGLNESDLNLEAMILEVAPEFDYVLAGEHLHHGFQSLENRYGIIELCCSTKPALLQRCFQNGNEIAIYLDPDAYLTSPLSSAIESLEQGICEAVFTPHLTSLGNLEMEISSMKHGVVNLGFLALKRTEPVMNFLSWWDSRLKTMCIKDPKRGIFTDQTWAALGLGVLKSKLIQDDGYNFATWNLAEHVVSRKNTKFYVDDSLLVFAHFSTFSVGGIEEFIRKYKVEVSESYFELLNIYTQAVEKSKSLLCKPISQAKRKPHYKKVSKIPKSSEELKIVVIDFLGAYLPSVLRLILKIKKNIRSKSA